MSKIDKFMNLMMEKEEDGLITPIFRLNNLSFVWIKCNNLYLVASTRTNSNVTLVITILHKIVQVFTEYFKEMEGKWTTPLCVGKSTSKLNKFFLLLF